MEDVFATVLALLSRGETAALSTVVSRKGSLPMSRKAKMVVTSEGGITGSVGGGCLEAEVFSEAKRVMESGEPTVRTFVLTEEHAGETGLTCGGRVEILTEPLVPGRSEDVFERIVRFRKERRRGVLATLLSGRRTSKMLIGLDGERVGSLGNCSLEDRVASQAKSVADGDLLVTVASEGDQAFVEAILPDPTLFLFGGGHISKAIAGIATGVGFRLVVVDDRERFANFERFPDADQVIVGGFGTILQGLAIDESSYLVVVTRGHQWDEQVIRQAVWTRACYIGMIGSRTKIASLWDSLEKEGVPRGLLDAVHSPIGLSIGADTPQEIGIAIVAELISVRRKTKGG